MSSSDTTLDTTTTTTTTTTPNTTTTTNMNNFSNQKGNRKCQVECGCKSIKFYITEDFITCSKFEQPSVYCHCKDCVGFPTICYEAAMKKKDDTTKATTTEKKDNQFHKAIDVVNHTLQGVNHVFFYKKNIERIRTAINTTEDTTTTTNNNNDILGWHKLTSETNTNRFYCKKCATPLGFVLKKQIAFYGALITKRDDIIYDSKCTISTIPYPFYAFNTTAVPETCLSKHDMNIIKYTSNLPIRPIAHFLSRDSLGSMLGLHQGTSLNPPSDIAGYSVGRDADTVALS